MKMRITDISPGVLPLLKTALSSLMIMSLLICPLHTPVLAEECLSLPKGTGENIELTKPYCVAAGEYNYGFINIHSGGKLIFKDAIIDF
jgi:hypothetical protein